MQLSARRGGFASKQEQPSFFSLKQLLWLSFSLLFLVVLLQLNIGSSFLGHPKEDSDYNSQPRKLQHAPPFDKPWNAPKGLLPEDAHRIHKENPATKKRKSKEIQYVHSADYVSNQKGIAQRKKGFDYKNLERLPITEIPYWDAMLESARKWGDIDNVAAMDAKYGFDPNKDKIRSASHGNSHCKFKGKVFAVGLIKTGTTSMNAAMSQLGYACKDSSCKHIGHWEHLFDAELLHDSANRIADAVLSIAEYYQFYRRVTKAAATFGDSPWNFMFPIFDRWYPGSKFILMTRASNEAYVNSYLRYLKGNSKNYVTHGLTAEEFGYLVLRRYELWNSFVINYFEHFDRMDDLLVFDINAGDKWQQLYRFLDCDKGFSVRRPFPHSNKSHGTRRLSGDSQVSRRFDYDWKSFFRNMTPRVDHFPEDNHKSLKRLRIRLVEGV